MSLRLRHHHLLCLLTYVGKGYSPAFTANFDRLAARISAGEAVLLVDGPDDVCAPLLIDADGTEPHCLRDGARQRDARAAVAVGAVLGRPVPAGTRITLDPPAIRDLRRAFAAGTVRSACIGCEWYDLCTTVAADGFGRALVTDRADPTPSPAAAS